MANVRRGIAIVSSLGVWLSISALILATETNRDVDSSTPDVAIGDAVPRGFALPGAESTVNEVVILEAQAPISLGNSQWFHGYYEFRFHLINRSNEHEKRVTLELPANEYGVGNRIRQLRRQVVLAPGASTTISLFQPPLPMYGMMARVTVNGIRRELAIETNRGFAESHATTSRPISVFASKAIGSALYTEASRIFGTSASAPGIPGMMPSSSSSVSTEFGVSLSEIPVDQWSTHWLSYSRFDGVALTATDARSAPPAVMEALRQYVAVGGTLMVLGDWQPPRDWQARLSSTSRYTVGFGVCAVIDEQDVSVVGEPQWGLLKQDWAQTSQPFRTNRDVEALNTTLPVVPELRIPVVGLLALMISFAVLLGPINLILLEHYRRRMWLLWTVPAISFFFCAAVWAFAIWNEGWTGYERTVGITILDQPQQRAATVGWTAFYQPLTPGGGLRYSRETELTPQVGLTGTRYHWRNLGRARTVDWTDQQQLTTGWVASRVPAYFLVRKPSVTVRERVNVRHDTDGSVKIVNGLGADIVQLYYRDLDGNLYNSGYVPAGQTVTLLEQPDSPIAIQETEPTAWRSIYESAWWLRMTPSLSDLESDSRIQGSILPGTYLARLNENPFMESGLAGRGNRDASALVIGIIGEVE